MVSSTPWPHFIPKKDPVPILQEAGWAPGLVWTDGKSRPHRDSIPNCPARSQSLYQLSYPAHCLCMQRRDQYQYSLAQCNALCRCGLPSAMFIYCLVSQNFSLAYHYVKVNNFSVPPINSNLILKSGIGILTDSRGQLCNVASNAVCQQKCVSFASLIF